MSWILTGELGSRSIRLGQIKKISWLASYLLNFHGRAGGFYFYFNFFFIWYLLFIHVKKLTILVSSDSYYKGLSMGLFLRVYIPDITWKCSVFKSSKRSPLTKVCFRRKLLNVLDMVGAIILFRKEMYGNKNKIFSWSGAFSMVGRGC